MFLALVLSGLQAFSSCIPEEDGFSVSRQGGPVKVAFSVPDGGGSASASTKTSVNSDGLSVSWENSDAVYLWAKDNGGNYVLANKEFRIYGSFEGDAVFTATLPQAMADGEYQYYACYPAPASVNGMTAVFNLPRKQNGKASGGSDIMVCGPVTGLQLEPVRSDGKIKYEDYSGLRLQMKHLVHLLKFFLPESATGFNGETVKKIEITMPGNVVGTVTTNLSDQSSGSSLDNGSAEIILDLSEPILPSSSGNRDYACAAIFPVSYSGDAVMSVKMYSDSWIGTADDIQLCGRNFLAGHTTPVSVSIARYVKYYALRLRLAGNNLGEPVQKITLSVPAGLHLGEEGSDTYVFEPGGDIGIGEEITLLYFDKDKYEALAGQTLNLTYESVHAITHQAIPLGDLTAGNSASFDMTVPYLLFEDFSGVPSFSSYDGYETANAGDKSAYRFLNGWTGGRAGASAGKCIRLAGRRECGLGIDAHYPARVDSAPIAQIKSPVDIEVTFSYGTNNQFSTIFTDTGDVGQTIYLGYVTSTNAYSSSKTTGTFESGNTITTSDKDGSWDSTPNTVSMTIHQIPAGTTNRITWRNDPEGKKDFGSNTTSWCYIDNIQVKIKNN